MSRDKADIIDEMNELKERIAELEGQTSNDEYDQMLDDSYETVTIAGIIFCPADILKECDPLAYLCGLNDYNDSLITNLESELSDLEDELKEATE